MTVNMLFGELKDSAEEGCCMGNSKVTEVGWFGSKRGVKREIKDDGREKFQRSD